MFTTNKKARYLGLFCLWRLVTQSCQVDKCVCAFADDVRTRASRPDPEFKEIIENIRLINEMVEAQRNKLESEAA
jgi:hypothetical protein